MHAAVIQTAFAAAAASCCIYFCFFYVTYEICDPELSLCLEVIYYILGPAPTLLLLLAKKTNDGNSSLEM